MSIYSSKKTCIFLRNLLFTLIVMLHLTWKNRATDVGTKIVGDVPSNMGVDMQTKYLLQIILANSYIELKKEKLHNSPKFRILLRFYMEACIGPWNIICGFHYYLWPRMLREHWVPEMLSFPWLEHWKFLTWTFYLHLNILC